MCYLVYNGDLHLLLKLILPEVPLQRAPENGDLIWQKPIVPGRPLCQGHPFVESVEPVVLLATHERRRVIWPILYDYGHVIQEFGKLRRQFLQRRLDQLVEILFLHASYCTHAGEGDIAGYKEWKYII
jgi:hypothetical protein